MDAKALREARARLIAQSRELVDLAGTEDRELTTEEDARFGKLLDEADALKIQYERMENLEAQELDLATSRGTIAGQADADADPNAAPSAGDPESRIGVQSTAEERQMAAFRTFLVSGPNGLSQGEHRALQADSLEAGGYLLAPQQFVASLIQAIDDLVFMRPLATKITVMDALGLGVASLDADPADADWTTEIKAVVEDTTMDFGKRELTPHPLSKLLKVSMKLLRTGQLNTEQLVRERLAYKYAITQEKGFLTGSGAAQPLGVFTASADGISTGRDVSTGNSTTAIAFDGLIEAKFSLKGGYWARSQWLFHRDAVRNITKLKDGEGQYIWRESVRVGEPDRLLGQPVMMSEYAPNTFTTGLYVGLLGDFSFYWIADSLSMQIQRLVELYAGNNQIGFIGRQETDGMPVLEEAFARVTLA